MGNKIHLRKIKKRGLKAVQSIAALSYLIQRCCWVSAIRFDIKSRLLIFLWVSDFFCPVPPEVSALKVESLNMAFRRKNVSAAAKLAQCSWI